MTTSTDTAGPRRRSARHRHGQPDDVERAVRLRSGPTAPRAAAGPYRGRAGPNGAHTGPTSGMSRSVGCREGAKPAFDLRKHLVPPAGFEPATRGLGNHCSIP